MAPIIDAAYTQPGYIVPWGTDVPGMAPMVEAMLAARPDLRPSDAFVIGWTRGQVDRGGPAGRRRERRHDPGGHQGRGLDASRASGSTVWLLTRATRHRDDPNTFATRAIAIFDPNLEAYTAAGGAAQTIGTAENGGTTGSDLVAGLLRRRNRCRLRLHRSLLRSLIDEPEGADFPRETAPSSDRSE